PALSLALPHPSPIPIRRPPRSPRLPYTSLFRSRRRQGGHVDRPGGVHLQDRPPAGDGSRDVGVPQLVEGAGAVEVPRVARARPGPEPPLGDVAVAAAEHLDDPAANDREPQLGGERRGEGGLAAGRRPGDDDVERAHSPVRPSRCSQRMSRWPRWRAVSSIMWTSAKRSVNSPRGWG